MIKVVRSIIRIQSFVIDVATSPKRWWFAAGIVLAAGIIHLFPGGVIAATAWIMGGWK